MYNSTREFEACVLVNGKPVTEVVHNGQTYLEGRKKSTYELYFRNNSSQQVLVVPSVDGLSIIDGQSAGKQSPGYVIDPWDTLTVPGWTVNGREAAEFIFHAQNAYYDDEQTYAEEMDEDSSNQGAIGFMVFRRKPRPSSVRKSFMPDRHNPWKSRGGSMGGSGLSGADGSGLDVNHVFSSSVLSSGNVAGSDGVSSSPTFTTTSASSGVLSSEPVDNFTCDSYDVDDGKSLGTGFGEAVEFETRSVEFERELNPCATFAFYYDTIKNLRRLGVPVERFNLHYSESVSSAPNPFPDSPEVTGYATTPRGWTGRRGSTRRKTRS